MAITDAEAARQMAELHPDLHESRQIAFGENYLQDLEQGTGTSQYYTGFGLAPDWVTGAIGAPAEAPIVQEPTPVIQDPMAGDAQVASQIAARDRDIADASTVSPMDQAGAVAAMTQPEAYNIPGTMPQTPVSGVWGPQDYLQDQTTTPITDQAGAVAAMTQPEAYSLPGESDPFLASGAAGGERLPATKSTIDLPSGDVFAAGDYSDVAGTLGDPTEKMDYTEKTPAWWETARDKFLNTGQDVGNFFTNLAGQGIDVAKMAGSAIMSMVAPGAGLLMKMIPEETQIDKFNREYALGGDLYENVVSQVDDPKFEGRLEGYADDLIAGTGEGKDPFGINTVSMYGDYPKYATDTYNKIVAKEEAGEELGQFEKDQKEYYGHISGLTGKTNIPGTPLMVDDSPLKTFPDEDIAPPENIIKPMAMPIYEDEFKDPDTWLNEIIDAENAAKDAAVTGVEGSPFILSQPKVYPEVQPDADISDEYDDLTFAAATEYSTKRAEEKAEAERVMQQQIREAEKAAATAKQAKHNAMIRAQLAASPHSRDPSGRVGGPPGGDPGWKGSRGGRVGYGKGGIVDLL